MDLNARVWQNLIVLEKSYLNQRKVKKLNLICETK
jgi:hypothetical protein